MLDIPVECINGSIAEGMEIPVKRAEGKIYEVVDCGNAEGYYEFRSNDDEILWALTEEVIGFTPDTEARYIIYFSDNGTTPSSCPYWDKCECYCYDDILFGITEQGGV